MKPQPEVIELNERELQAKLNQIEAALGSETAEPFRQLLGAYITLVGMLREKNITIHRLRKLFFGSSSERSSDILPEAESSSEPTTDERNANTDVEEADAVSDEAGQEDDSRSQTEPASPTSPESEDEQRKRSPGHGRNPASMYTGCLQELVNHDSLSPGDECPECGKGRLYRQSQWSPVVRLIGQPPVGGTVYQLERLRCHLCGRVHTADLPEEAGPTKYDPSVASIIATLRYGEGFPWNRIQRIQQSAGIPLPASTQWDIVRDAIPGGVEAAYRHLLGLGAQGELVHNDDTPMQVLALQKKLQKQEPLLEEDPERRGIFTTTIVSRSKERPTIALFFTGPHHAGENLRNVLSQRQQGLALPIQMCDGLSRNMPHDLQVIIANCLTHGRRKFVEVIEAFPSEAEYVIECLKVVYKTDADARKEHLSPEERWRLHQANSQPVMDQLHEWLNQQLDERKVEPNSSLGGAISYMLNRWDKLTLFLRVPGAPLDNNIAERALKMAIRHRRNSLFYKTMRGAAVGDIYMSMIHTCYFAGADPFHYLTALQRHSPRVVDATNEWMPWNYREQLGEEDARTDSNRSPPAEVGLASP